MVSAENCQILKRVLKPNVLKQTEKYTVHLDGIRVNVEHDLRKHLGCDITDEQHVYRSHSFPVAAII